MPSFLNLNLDGKINTNFVFKHILFSAFWILGILLLVFRLDIIIVEKYSESLNWLKISIPTIYFCLLIALLFYLKWYYILAFFFYPFLMLFWFIPKTVLSIGKVYLFGSYLNFIFSRLAHFKLLVFNIFLFVFSSILLIMVKENWTRWISIIAMSYFYLVYIYSFLRKSFKQPTLLGTDIEESIKKFIDNKSQENSFVINSFIIQKNDEKLQVIERREAQIRRTLMAKFVIEQLTNKLSGYRGRQAYLVSWIFGAIVFLVTSVIFFWFLNFQLFKIDTFNFTYKGTFPSFDFLYYTIKTITYGNIELISPISVLARISETTSFLTIGIFALVIVVSVFLSMKQDKVNENIKLTTDIFNSQNLILTNYMQDEFGMEISTAMNEIKNIDSSLKKLREFIDKIF